MKERFISMRLLKYTLISLLSLGSQMVIAQSITGGQYAFEYLRLSNSAHVAALGGITVANPGNDIAFALQNPAMMRPGLHNDLELTYDAYYAGITVMNLQYGYYVPKINTSFFFGVQYLNYGGIQLTDPLGNINGTFHAVDYDLTLGASRKYKDHWRYGADVKMASSALYQSTAKALLTDVGINYYDTASLWDFGATAKNMGVMVKTYTAGNFEPVPFDLQLGVSKKFKHLPLRLFTTMHHVYEWDIRYDNPADLTGTSALGTNDTINDKGSHFGDKLFRHFIFGAELTFGNRVTITASYNDLQRKEMELTSMPGIAGFAFGLGINLNKFQIHYGRSYYSIAGPYNELSITMALNKLMGLAKTGDKMHWSEEYPDWE